MATPTRAVAPTSSCCRAAFPMATTCAAAPWRRIRRSCDVMRAKAKAGTPVLGICNGFQILVRIGAAAGRADAQRRRCKFICRDVHLQASSTLDTLRSPAATAGARSSACPIAHAEATTSPTRRRSTASKARARSCSAIPTRKASVDAGDRAPTAPSATSPASRDPTRPHSRPDAASGESRRASSAAPTARGMFAGLRRPRHRYGHREPNSREFRLLTVTCCARRTGMCARRSLVPEGPAARAGACAARRQLVINSVRNGRAQPLGPTSS